MKKFVFPFLQKISTKLQQKFMLYKSVMKQQIKYVISNNKSCSFFTKYLHLYSYSKIMCLWMSSTFLELPLLGNPQVTINMNNKSQQEFKIQTPNYLMAYSYP
jgi:hypothetical protein